MRNYNEELAFLNARIIENREALNVIKMILKSILNKIERQECDELTKRHQRKSSNNVIIVSALWAAILTFIAYWLQLS